MTDFFSCGMRLDLSNFKTSSLILQRSPELAPHVGVTTVYSSGATPKSFHHRFVNNNTNNASVRSLGQLMQSGQLSSRHGLLPAIAPGVKSTRPGFCRTPHTLNNGFNGTYFSASPSRTMTQGLAARSTPVHQLQRPPPLSDSSSESLLFLCIGDRAQPNLVSPICIDSPTECANKLVNHRRNTS